MTGDLKSLQDDLKDARAKLLQWQLTTVFGIFGSITAHILFSDTIKVSLCDGKRCSFPPGPVDEWAAWQKLGQALLIVGAYFVAVGFGRKMVAFYRARVVSLASQARQEPSVIMAKDPDLAWRVPLAIGAGVVSLVFLLDVPEFMLAGNWRAGVFMLACLVALSAWFFVRVPSYKLVVAIAALGFVVVVAVALIGSGRRAQGVDGAPSGDTWAVYLRGESTPWGYASFVRSDNGHLCGYLDSKTVWPDWLAKLPDEKGRATCPSLPRGRKGELFIWGLRPDGPGAWRGDDERKFGRTLYKKPAHGVHARDPIAGEDYMIRIVCGTEDSCVAEVEIVMAWLELMSLRRQPRVPPDQSARGSTMSRARVRSLHATTAS